MSKSSRTSPIAALAAVAMAASIAPAVAHPHVWVTVRDEIVFKDGRMTGVEHHWTFDDGYTEMAIEGLDVNGDGTYSREELKELAQTNIDGLKDFDNFTFATIGNNKLTFDPPRDYWLEYTDHKLTLNFFLPLKEPLTPPEPGISIEVTDPSIFIAFSFAEKDAVTASKDKPENCKVAFVPSGTTSDQQALSNAFATEFVVIGSGDNGSISVSCAK